MQFHLLGKFVGVDIKDIDLPTEMKRAMAKQAEAERRIQKARQQALSSVRQVAAEAARAATNRLIGVEPSQADADAAIDGKG